MQKTGRTGRKSGSYLCHFRCNCNTDKPLKTVGEFEQLIAGQRWIALYPVPDAAVNPGGIWIPIQINSFTIWLVDSLGLFII